MTERLERRRKLLSQPLVLTASELSQFCIHTTTVFDEVFNVSNGFLSAKLYFCVIILLSLSIIITTINAVLVRWGPACVGDLLILVLVVCWCAVCVGLFFLFTERFPTFISSF